VWEQEPGVVSASIVVLRARDAGRAAGIDEVCAGAVFAGTDAEIESDATTPSKQMLAARSLRHMQATISKKYYKFTKCMLAICNGVCLLRVVERVPQGLVFGGSVARFERRRWDLGRARCWYGVGLRP